MNASQIFYYHDLLEFVSGVLDVEKRHTFPLLLLFCFALLTVYFFVLFTCFCTLIGELRFDSPAFVLNDDIRRSIDLPSPP